MTTATFTRRYNPLPDFNFPLSMYGKSEKLPYHFYIDDFDLTDCNRLIVNRDIPEAGWLKAQSIEEHYRELFRLGYDDDEYLDD